MPQLIIIIIIIIISIAWAFIFLFFLFFIYKFVLSNNFSQRNVWFREDYISYYMDGVFIIFQFLIIVQSLQFDNGSIICYALGLWLNFGGRGKIMWNIFLII